MAQGINRQEISAHSSRISNVDFLIFQNIIGWMACENKLSILKKNILSRQETPNSVYKIVHETLQRWPVTKDDRDTTDQTEHAYTSLNRAFFSNRKSRKWKRSRSRRPLGARINYMAPRWCMAARATGMIGAWASIRSARTSNTTASRSEM